MDIQGLNDWVEDYFRDVSLFVGSLSEEEFLEWIRVDVEGIDRLEALENLLELLTEAEMYERCVVVQEEIDRILKK